MLMMHILPSLSCYSVVWSVKGINSIWETVWNSVWNSTRVLHKYCFDSFQLTISILFHFMCWLLWGLDLTIITVTPLTD